MTIIRNKNYKAKCHLWLVAFAFLLVCNVGCGGSAKKTPTNNLAGRTIIDVSDVTKVDTLRFGRVRAGEVVEIAIAFTNTSEKPLLMLSTETSCGCLELDYTKEPLRMGEKSAATMTFYSSGYNYFPPRAFYIKTSSSSEPKKLVVMADME
jgi:hypothetical protein